MDRYDDIRPASVGVQRWAPAAAPPSNPWTRAAARLGLAMWLIATGAGAATPSDEVGAANAFRPHELVRAGRDDGESPRIEYHLLWPERGEPPEALARVRAAVWSAWAEDPDEPAASPLPPEPADVARAMAVIADRVAARYREFRRAHPEVPGGWSDRRRVDMVSRVEPWLSITVAREWFFGGAHPVRRIRHFVFDLDSGRVLAPEDVFGPVGGEEFARRVRRALLSARAGSPDAPPEAAGLSPDATIVPTNWFVDHRGFGVTFQEAEIAPRVAGPITVCLGRGEVEDLLRPTGPKERR